MGRVDLTLIAKDLGEPKRLFFVFWGTPILQALSETQCDYNCDQFFAAGSHMYFVTDVICRWLLRPLIALLFFHSERENKDVYTALRSNGQTCSDQGCNGQLVIN